MPKISYLRHAELQQTFKHNYRSGAKARVSHNKSRQNNSLNLRMTPVSYVPRSIMQPMINTTVTEESSIVLTSSATGTISQRVIFNLATASNYATQWLQIYDEWRMNLVQFRYHSRSGSNTPGAIVMYIDRDTSDPADLTLVQAYRQQESQSFRPWDDFVTSPKLTTLQWKPKDPQDREFNFTPTLSQFSIVIVAEGLPISTTIGTIETVSRIQFRGRSTVL